MKTIFSRKGFDSGRKSGGAPSPIIGGVPISLPIPTGKYPSETTYGDLDLGDALSKLQNKYATQCFCHDDPMFWDDRCAFGQTGAAQTHLEDPKRGRGKVGVGEGDVFLFFGLFEEPGSKDRHHPIFGYLKVEKVIPIDSQPTGKEVTGTPRRHPHTIAKWDNGKTWPKNNTIYFGRGKKAKTAHKALRLTKEGAKTSLWHVPLWLRERGLTFHPPSRWLDDVTLCSAYPGQEFVTDIEDSSDPKEWLDKIIAAVETDE